jgi:nicotinamide-nucleotide amidase
MVSYYLCKKVITMNASEFNSFLQDRKLNIATAESITAGLLASTIASVSGASASLKGGIITYSEELKTKLLGVDPEVLKKYSAESAQTTIEMVKGLSNLGLNADIYVAVTGVASASVNEYKINKSVGQIYVAILFENQLHSFDTIISTDQHKDPRNYIREKTVSFIFDKIEEIVLKKSSI